MKKPLSLLLCLALLVCSVAVRAEEDHPVLPGLTFLEETEREYAQWFRIFRYEGGYSLIEIPGSGRYLVVPQEGAVPEGLEADIAVLRQPLNRIYLAATAVMALFDAMDALDAIRLTGTQADGWYVDAAVQALQDGRMLFAGRYSEPDYETMLLEDCQLAIESTMIYHTPKVKEMIEALGIPVLVDHASYESHPLGRTEWIKVYAALAGKEAEAEEFFREQTQVLDRLKNVENTGKTVAFFFVNSDGSVVVRTPNDYIAQMVELGGGKYICPSLPDTDAATASVTMESFYAAAWDADYLIYNSSKFSVPNIFRKKFPKSIIKISAFFFIIKNELP